MTATRPPSPAEEYAAFVRDGLTWGLSAEQIEERWQAQRHAETLLAETTDPAVLLPAIREALAMRAKIERIVKTLSTPALYRIVTDAGVVSLGPSSRWASRPAEFSAAFLDIGEMPTLPKGPARHELCTMIARAAEPEDIGDEATDEGWMRAALVEYLSQRPPVDTLDEAVTSLYPWTGEDGRVVIFAPALRDWLLLGPSPPADAVVRRRAPEPLSRRPDHGPPAGRLGEAGARRAADAGRRRVRVREAQRGPRGSPSIGRRDVRAPGEGPLRGGRGRAKG